MVTARSNLGGAVGWVRYQGCPVSGEGTNNCVEADEGGYDAPRVYGRKVWNIVEEAAEKDVVGKGVYWSGGGFLIHTLSVNNQS